MSLILTLYGNDGIVMASDSRCVSTINNVENNEKRDGFSSDFSQKTFIVTPTCGVSYCGDASCNTTLMETIMKNFVKTACTSITVAEVASKLYEYIKTYYPTISPSFQVAGYDSGDRECAQKFFNVYTDKREIDYIQETKIGTNAGIVANGMTDIITSLWNNVAWESFTLQDKIDYCKYAIDVTAQTMRFKNVRRTVGGSAEILLIEPSGTTWIQHKQLK